MSVSKDVTALYVLVQTCTSLSIQFRLAIKLYGEEGIVLFFLFFFLIAYVEDSGVLIQEAEQKFGGETSSEQGNSF